MTKRESIAIVLLITIILSILLVSQADADVSKGFEARATGIIRTGGTVRTQAFSQWEIYKWAEEKLPTKYPFRYAPWQTYANMEKYVFVSSDKAHNTLTVKPDFYRLIRPEADANRTKARRILRAYKVRGKGKAAVKKIRKYVRKGKYKAGIKSASGFFDSHSGDCAAHASAIYVLCKVQGVPVRYCIGSMDGELHAWNRVKACGKWYWVDETLDMPMSRRLWDGYKKPMEMW